MSRRSIKTIRQDIDLSSVLNVYQEIPIQVDSENFFNNTLPIELEIGSGKGRFLLGAAAIFRDCNFIGVEISQKYARFVASKLLPLNLSNVKVICCDAAKLLAERIREGGLRAVHVYFPDPWWKRAHRKRRILRSEVLQLIESRLVSGGTLYFRTDVNEYFNSTIELIEKYTTLKGQFEIPENDTTENLQTNIENLPVNVNVFDIKTSFEHRTKLHGEKVYRAKFIKK